MMQYNDNNGKNYDTIFFFIMYFNKKKIDFEYKSAYDNTDYTYDYFWEIKNVLKEKIPLFLSPLFYIGNGNTSVISLFFLHETNFSSDNIDNFIVKINKNADLLYRSTLNILFRDYLNSEKQKSVNWLAPEDYIEAINSLNVSDNFKLQISYLLNNFDYAISVLTVYLKKIYQLIDELHKKHIRDITFEFDQIKSEQNVELYKNSFKYEPELSESTQVSITLMNQYLVLYLKKENALLLGIKHQENIADNFDESKKSSDNFIITCGSEIRMKMIYALIDNGEMTSSQIAKYIGCPVTTLIRNINILQLNGIIYISSHEGLQIFYKLNTRLLKKVKKNIDILFEQIFNNNRKDVTEDETEQ